MGSIGAIVAHVAAQMSRAREVAEVALTPARAASGEAGDTAVTSTTLGRVQARGLELKPPRMGASARVSIGVGTQDVLAAWRLVHDEYVRAGILATPRPHGVHAPERILDAAPIVLTRTEGASIQSTLAVVPDGPRGLPADGVASFAAALDAMRASGARLIEIGMFARRNAPAQRSGLGGASLRSEAATGSNGVQELFGAAFALARREDATHVVVTVHPRHARFYAQMLGFREVAGRADHPTVDGAPAVLLAVETREPALAALERLAPSATATVPDLATRSALMTHVREALSP